MRNILGTFWTGYKVRRWHAYECSPEYITTGDSDGCWDVEVGRWDAFWWAASATWGFVRFELWMRRRKPEDAT